MSFCCEAEDCEAQECQSRTGPFNFNTENLGDLNIDLNNDELIMDENQIAELLEVRNFDTIKIDDTIEELECEIVESGGESHVEAGAESHVESGAESHVEADVPSDIPSDVPVNVVS
jgi:hypothetical protein